jgi:hypothetical protein
MLPTPKRLKAFRTLPGALFNAQINSHQFQTEETMPEPQIAFIDASS